VDRDISVSTATGTQAVRPSNRISIPGRMKNLYFLHTAQKCSGATQPPIRYAIGAVYSGVKWQGREVDQLSPSSAEVMSGGPIHPFPYSSSWRHDTLIILSKD
jgi:hypothetical protein